jgi:hypothetical protein
MRIRTYRDQARSAHLDLTGGGDHPWTVDLISVSAAAFLLIGFAAALAQLLLV